jgi:hypothetical protein
VEGTNLNKEIVATLSPKLGWGRYDKNRKRRNYIVAALRHKFPVCFFDPNI